MTNEMISVYFNIAIKIRRVCQRISDIFISFLLDDFFFFRWPNIYSLSFCQDYAGYKCVQSFRIEGIVLLTYFRGRQLYIYIHFCTFSSSIVCVCMFVCTSSQRNAECSCWSPSYQQNRYYTQQPPRQNSIEAIIVCIRLFDVGAYGVADSVNRLITGKYCTKKKE